MYLIDYQLYISYCGQALHKRSKCRFRFYAAQKKRNPSSKMGSARAEQSAAGYTPAMSITMKGLSEHWQMRGWAKGAVAVYNLFMQITCDEIK